jgi:Secretion system C-terminal sorting domain
MVYLVLQGQPIPKNQNSNPMKCPYSIFSVTFLFGILLLFNYTPLKAQCPVGYPPGSTAFDTTITTPAGINTIQIKFPQFDPHEGMLTCVKLCISITGVVDSVSVENNSTSLQTQTADVYYIRTDQITGPGLIAPLTNSINYHYPTFSLGPSDGILGSGPDFASISHDTLLNAVSVCRTLSDSASIIQFYGTDSVTYNYNISAFTNVSCSGGNYNSTVATSAFVNFHFEYCTCPGVVLPLNIYQFSATKIGQKALLKWNGFDNSNSSYYHYEAQVSRNGVNFETFEIIPKNNTGVVSYSSIFNIPNTGRYFFRIKQVNDNSRSYFTNIKYIDAGSETPIKFIVYPNPSNGIVGIKFDNITAGKYVVLINNAQGQTVVSKEIEVAGYSYQQVATLIRGFYWVRLTNVANQLSCVNQLFIK